MEVATAAAGRAAMNPATFRLVGASEAGKTINPGLKTQTRISISQPLRDRIAIVRGRIAERHGVLSSSQQQSTSVTKGISVFLQDMA